MTIRSCFVCALAVMLGAATGHAADRGGELPGIGSAFGDDTRPLFQAQEAQGVGAGFARGIDNRPKLYDNTTVCTVRTNWLAVGSTTGGTNLLNIRDWFTTHGGKVEGFDLFLVNAGTLARPISNFEFFDGTDAEDRGVEFEPKKFFRTTGSPSLEKIPPNPNNSEWPIKVSVDYINDLYTISYGVLNEDTFEFPNADIQQVLGVGNNGRTSFDLPAGKIGINFRTSGQSKCHDPNADPQFGPVMALGGEGAVDGVHIVGAEDPPGNDPGCTQGERDQLPCPGSPTPWDGVDPCLGGDVCNLDRPFYSIAMILYVGAGPDELGDGNNEIATAQVIPPPSVGDGSMSTVHGFLGDNGQSYTGTPVTCFDSDLDGEVTVLDYAGFQRCFGDDVSPECGLYDCGGDGNVDLTDFQAFQIAAEGGDPGCVCQIPDPPTLLKDVDIYEVSGLTAGQVMSILLEGSQSPSEGPLWDPAYASSPIPAGASPKSPTSMEG
ncbi:MAG: hypothetical protein IID39_01200 [Planctomycetes bacterium]|nr:hypothetical protein [Planctomycetota bacterium]